MIINVTTQQRALASRVFGAYQQQTAVVKLRNYAMYKNGDVRLDLQRLDFFVHL